MTTVGQDGGTCGSSVEASLSEMVKINCARQVSGIRAGDVGWGGGEGKGEGGVASPYETVRSVIKEAEG